MNTLRQAVDDYLELRRGLRFKLAGPTDSQNVLTKIGVDPEEIHRSPVGVYFAGNGPNRISFVVPILICSDPESVRRAQNRYFHLIWKLLRR